MESKRKTVHHSEVVVELNEAQEQVAVAKERSSSGDSADPQFKQICAICSSSAVVFTNYPCECCAFCKKCAMKVATGGKCKVCHNIFSTMRGIGTKD